MTDQGHLSEGKFSYIVRYAPLPSLDLIGIPTAECLSDLELTSPQKTTILFQVA